MITTQTLTVGGLSLFLDVVWFILETPAQTLKSTPEICGLGLSSDQDLARLFSEAN